MAVAALLKFIQGATVGTAGRALLGASGTAVQVSNGAGTPGPVSVWTFTVIATPNASSIPLGVAQTGATTTWSFTPDAPGCFIIELTVEDVFNNVSSDARAFGVLTTSGRLIPSFTGDPSSLNFGGQTTGWDVYMEAWLLALEALIDSGGSGGGAPFDEDCTAGGTIVYDGPSPIPPLVNFTGTPGGGFTFTPPSAAFATTFQNSSGHPATIGASGYVLQNGTYALFVNPGGGDFCEPATAVNAIGPTAGDILTFNSNSGPTQSAIALAGVNTTYAGETPFVPLYAVLQQFDSLLYGEELPSGSSGPQSPAAAQTWYQSPADPTVPSWAYGEFVFTESGVTECVGPQTYYPGEAWTTQAQTQGVARTADRITGTSQQVIHYIPLVDLPSGAASLLVTKVVAKAAVVGSGLCVLGDFASSILSLSASSTAGTAVAGTPTVLVPPATASSTNFSDVAITVAIVGDDYAISVVSSTTAGSTDATDFQTRTSAEIC